MLFRVLMIVGVIILIAWPLYRLLLKTASKLFNEFCDDEENLDSKLESIVEEKERLKEQCKQTEKDARESIRTAQRVGNKLKRS